MRETRTSSSEGGGSKPIDSPYPYSGGSRRLTAFCFEDVHTARP